jgi:hypothetical protein
MWTYLIKQLNYSNHQSLILDLHQHLHLKIKKKHIIQASTHVIKFASKNYKEIMDVMYEIKDA